MGIILSFILSLWRNNGNETAIGVSFFEVWRTNAGAEIVNIRLINPWKLSTLGILSISLYMHDKNVKILFLFYVCICIKVGSIEKKQH